ncbi:MAG: mevalonate kinase [Myxococcota bacterium]
MDTARGRGAGKIILFGEHAVVHGTPALAAALGLGVSAEANAADTSRISIEPWSLDLSPDDDHAIARAFAALLATYESAQPVHVHLKVDLPGGAGLGCSAAMGVATCEALDAVYQVERSRLERGAHTLVWEHVFHGNPSGVDNAVSAAGGVVLFRRGQTPEPVVPRHALPLVIAHSGESSSTKEIVAMVGRQYERERERVQQAFDAIESVVMNGKLAIEQGELKSVGQLMTMNQLLLSGLMLSTERIETLCRAAEGAGALGAKLTGAGAGGCMIALAEDIEHAREIEKAMVPHASMTFVTAAGISGPTESS